MKRVTFLIITLTFFALVRTYAAVVEVKKVEDNKNGVYVVSEMTEGDKFFHDRDYTITGIPKEFLGLTQVRTSADSPGGQDLRLTFEIDRPAFVYTGKSLFLDAPHPTTEYFIYKSNQPYDKGKVEILGIDEVIGDPVIMWTIFLEEGTLAVQPGEKLTTTWGTIKSER